MIWPLTPKLILLAPFWSPPLKNRVPLIVVVVLLGFCHAVSALPNEVCTSDAKSVLGMPDEGLSYLLFHEVFSDEVICISELPVWLSILLSFVVKFVSEPYR